MLVKICGITNIDDARYSLAAGADWIGLNLVSGPRRIDLAGTENILAQLDDPGRVVVLISLDGISTSTSLLTTLHKHGVRRLQLYGTLSVSTLRGLASEEFESIVVRQVTDRGSLVSLDEVLKGFGETRPSYLLFDAGTVSQPGGTGKRADWTTIAQAQKAGRFDDWPPVLLAGGLTPTNVAEAISRTSPFGVDVSSGVEVTPGRKDHAKITAFVSAAREAKGD